MDTPTARWLETISGQTSARKIGAELGRGRSTISRWKRDGIPLAALIRLCVDRELDLPAALVAVGVITEAESRRLPRNLAVVPLWHLTAELHRRAVKQRRSA